MYFNLFEDWVLGIFFLRYVLCDSYKIYFGFFGKYFLEMDIF